MVGANTDTNGSYPLEFLSLEPGGACCASNAVLETFSEYLSDILWVMSGDGKRLLFISKAYERLTGHSRESHYKNGHQWIQHIHPDDRERVKTLWEASINGTEMFDIEYRWMRTDGTYVWLKDRGFPVRDSNGNITRICGIGTDVTARKMAENDAVNLMRQREDFVAALTHDLKTPLVGANRILSMIAAGNVGKVTSEAAFLISKVIASNNGILSLIRNLLDCYRSDSEPLAAMKQTVDIADLMTSCLNDVAGVAQNKGLIIERSIASATLNADPMAIRRLIQNLLDNAIKFSKQNGRICIAVGVRGEAVELSVADEGPGMSQDEMRSVFNRFRQGRIGRTVELGSGLGLYICKQIVDAHNGDIACASEPGAGTTFTVSLPVSASPRVDLELESAASRQKEGAHF